MELLSRLLGAPHAGGQRQRLRCISEPGRLLQTGLAPPVVNAVFVWGHWDYTGAKRDGFINGVQRDSALLSTRVKVLGPLPTPHRPETCWSHFPFPIFLLTQILLPQTECQTALV